MLVDFLSLFSFLFYLLYFTKPTRADRYHCYTPFLGSGTPGFKARFFNFLYSEYDNVYHHTEYLFMRATEFGPSLGEVEGVTDPNFDLTVKDGEIVWDKVYGFNTTVTNFTLELTGYFIPPSSGVYTVELYDVDTSAILLLGDSSAFYCGDPESHDSNLGDIGLDGIGSWDDSRKNFIRSYLKEGVAYPMRVVYENNGNTAALNLKWTDPDKEAHTKWEDVVTFYEKSGTEAYPTNMLTTTTTSRWTERYTTTLEASTTTYLGSDTLPTTEVIYLILLPYFTGDTISYSSTVVTSQSFTGIVLPTAETQISSEDKNHDRHDDLKSSSIMQENIFDDIPNSRNISETVDNQSSKTSRTTSTTAKTTRKDIISTISDNTTSNRSSSLSSYANSANISSLSYLLTFIVNFVAVILL